MPGTPKMLFGPRFHFFLVFVCVVQMHTFCVTPKRTRPITPSTPHPNAIALYVRCTFVLAPTHLAHVFVRNDGIRNVTRTSRRFAQTFLWGRRRDNDGRGGSSSGSFGGLSLNLVRQGRLLIKIRAFEVSEFP